MVKGPTRTTKSLDRALTATRGEHVWNVLKAGLQLVPGGGTVVRLLDDYIPAAKRDRLETFLYAVASDLDNLDEEVDELRLKSNEFTFIVEQCLKGVSENYQAEKLESFRAIFIRSACSSNADADEHEFFLGLVASLSAVHIRILRAFRDPESAARETELPDQSLQGLGWRALFDYLLPDIDPHIIERAFSDLHRLGLIKNDESVFSSMGVTRGIQLLHDRLTEIGVRFIDFCTLPEGLE